MSDPDHDLLRRDLVVALLVAVLAIVGWFLPARVWPAAAAKAARLRTRMRAPLDDDDRDIIRTVVGERSRAWIDRAFWPRWLAHKYLSWIQILACHRPWPGSLPTVLSGREHLDTALADGRGAMLWSATFAYKDLAMKAALARAGYSVSHLSRKGHGFGDSAWGQRWLNPLYTRIEERFLRERIVIDGTNMAEVTRTMKDRLARNGVLSVTVLQSGRHVAVRPFLNGHIRIATGSLKMACDCGTPVLPVFVVRGDDGRLMVEIGSALRRPADRPLAEQIDAMIDDLVSRLAPYAGAHPDQFLFPLADQEDDLLIEPIPGPTSRPASREEESRDLVEAAPSHP